MDGDIPLTSINLPEDCKIAIQRQVKHHKTCCSIKNIVGLITAALALIILTFTLVKFVLLLTTDTKISAVVELDKAITILDKLKTSIGVLSPTGSFSPIVLGNQTEHDARNQTEIETHI